jgi:hypothetical protein
MLHLQTLLLLLLLVMLLVVVLVVVVTMQPLLLLLLRLLCMFCLQLHPLLVLQLNHVTSRLPITCCSQ